MKKLLFLLLALPIISCAQDSTGNGSVHNVPEWDWIKIEETKYINFENGGNHTPKIGGACGISKGGKVTVLAQYDDDYVLCIFNKKGAGSFGTNCADGVVFLYPKQTLSYFNEITETNSEKKTAKHKRIIELLEGSKF